MNDAVSEASLVEEFELCPDLVGKRPFAAAHQDGPEEQIALIDQAVGKRLASELGTPDRDVSLRGLLQPADRIGVEVSEGFQLHPEQSTTAIICHHPAAKYFVA